MKSEELLKLAIEQLDALEEYQFLKLDKTDPMSEIIYERIVKTRDLIMDVLEGY